MKRLLVAVVFGSATTFACGGAKAPAESAPAAPSDSTFTYAPVVGRTFRHTMKRHEEMAIVGAPLRQSENWEIGWEMKIEEESNLIRVRANLKSLKLAHNGAQALVGDEVAPAGAFVELLMDKTGKIVDVRRTATISEAIASVVAPEFQEAARAYFSAEALRQHFIALAHERTADLLGHSAAVGETWVGEASAEEAAAAERKLTVESEKPCGKDTCVVVRREVTVNPDVVWAAGRARVDAYVRERGGDPTKVTLTKADIELQDTFEVNPKTLEFHHATFHQKAALSVATAEGVLSVTFTLDRESIYEY